MSVISVHSGPWVIVLPDEDRVFIVESLNEGNTDIPGALITTMPIVRSGPAMLSALIELTLALSLKEFPGDSKIPLAYAKALAAIRSAVKQ